MGDNLNSIINSPLVRDAAKPGDQRIRLLLFVVWCGLAGWFLSNHVPWRDEVRAFSLALSGSNFAEMLENVHGEGHPALWYLLLRGMHDLFPYREVLPIAGALTGIAAMAIFTFLSPFRIVIVGLVLFSFYGAFEYVAVARNYAIAALIMFLVAALYERIKDGLWLGVLVALLANTNVPACILAGCFILYRFAELMGERSVTARRQWLVFFGNALVAAVGAWLCFRTVYPTFNDGAVSPRLSSISIVTFGRALVDTDFGFHRMGPWPPLLNLLVFASCLGLLRSRTATMTAIAAFAILKLFFYIIYPSDYRHELLFILFLLSLHWMVALGPNSSATEPRPMKFVRLFGVWAFVNLLLSQSVLLIKPIRAELNGMPYSQAADVAAILRQPKYRDAIIMGDPDAALDAFAYYVDNPVWMLREQRFGKFSRLIKNSRRELTLDDVLADAKRLHDRTGRSILYLSTVDIERVYGGRHHSMFRNFINITPENRARFRASTRLIAKRRTALSGEHYNVYAYPGD